MTRLLFEKALKIDGRFLGLELEHHNDTVKFYYDDGKPETEGVAALDVTIKWLDRMLPNCKN